MREVPARVSHAIGNRNRTTTHGVKLDVGVLGHETGTLSRTSKRDDGVVGVVTRGPSGDVEEVDVGDVQGRRKIFTPLRVRVVVVAAKEDGYFDQRCLTAHRPLSSSPGNEDGLVGVGGVYVLPSDVLNVSGTTTLDGFGVIVAREDLRGHQRRSVQAAATKEHCNPP
jgi:hypothetical protein